jgi:hypothetical protein
MAGIGALPADLLVNIFELAVPGCQEGYLFAMPWENRRLSELIRIAGVCQHWRGLVLNHASFWSELEVRCGLELQVPSPAALPSLAALPAALRRQRELSISLVVCQDCPPSQLHEMLLQLPALERVRIFSFPKALPSMGGGGVRTPFVAPQQLWESFGSHPSLRALTVRSPDTLQPANIAALSRLTQLELDASTAAPGVCAALAGLASLRELELSFAAFDAPDGEQPFLVLSNLSSLTALTILLGPNLFQMPPPSSLHLLRSFHLASPVGIQLPGVEHLQTAAIDRLELNDFVHGEHAFSCLLFQGIHGLSSLRDLLAATQLLDRPPRALCFVESYLPVEALPAPQLLDAFTALYFLRGRLSNCSVPYVSPAAVAALIAQMPNLQHLRLPPHSAFDASDVQTSLAAHPSGNSLSVGQVPW